MKITAAVVREKATELHIESLELDEPLADEVLVKIVGTGVCHTDMWSEIRATRCHYQWY